MRRDRGDVQSAPSDSRRGSSPDVHKDEIVAERNALGGHVT
jgi:hypothetical protein